MYILVIAALQICKNLSIITAEKKQYSCNMCKVLKRMSRSSIAPTTQTTSRRSNQSKNIINGRGSASQVTTPLLTTQHINGRISGSGVPAIANTIKDNMTTCDIPSHANLQQQIDKINSTLHELHIQCNNNNTMLNFLKQENQRLVGSLQQIPSSTKTLRTIHSLIQTLIIKIMS